MRICTNDVKALQSSLDAFHSWAVTDQSQQVWYVASSVRNPLVFTISVNIHQRQTGRYPGVVVNQKWNCTGFIF